jgi:hypothetical protein
MGKGRQHRRVGARSGDQIETTGISRGQIRDQRPKHSKESHPCAAFPDGLPRQALQYLHDVIISATGAKYRSDSGHALEIVYEVLSARNRVFHAYAKGARR